MGKFAQIALCAFVTLLAPLPAHAKAHRLATSLPSEVKRVGPQRKDKGFQVTPLQNGTKNLPAKRKRAPVVLADTGISPFANRYFSRSVHFWHSTSHIPSSYQCDEEISAAKLQEAEQQARSRCQSSGDESCELHSVRIVKRGKLSCADIPNTICHRKEFYVGCVAEALVIGEKGEPSVAQNEPLDTASDELPDIWQNQ